MDSWDPVGRHTRHRPAQRGQALSPLGDAYSEASELGDTLTSAVLALPAYKPAAGDATSSRTPTTHRGEAYSVMTEDLVYGAASLQRGRSRATLLEALRQHPTPSDVHSVLQCTLRAPQRVSQASSVRAWSMVQSTQLVMCHVGP